MISKPILAAGLVGLALAGQPAFAKSVPVHYDDLNLASPAGQKTLDARVRAAARKVCEIGTQRMTLEEWNSARSCYNDAVSSARKAYAELITARRPG